jgi:chromate reductase, NAD(P)H dehydrogenase (quinone)
MSNGASTAIKILGLSGSLREKSFNTALLRAAISLVPPGMTITVGSFAEFPLYNADMQAKGFPQPVQTLAGQIRDADAVLIVSPEYNYTIPGGLKNAIDWVSRVDKQPFDGKLIAVMGASPGKLGTARMQYHMRQSFVFLNGFVLNRPEVMVANAESMFDEQGKLTDEPTRKIVGDLLTALAKAVADQRLLKSATR